VIGRVGSARHPLGDHLGRHQLGRGLELLWRRQHLGEVAAEVLVDPEAMSGPDRLLLVGLRRRSLFQGWKWSEIRPAWKPASSARRAPRMSSDADRSSLESVIPMIGMS
jgi:hypothetical protein